MPELADDMYCSQQIMVPPMFPYILRQYAKAAIRSQPTDLLRWSTAYFRCLSLNLPPPVKPRLEYPLPQDYDGVTPGWLKALLYQLANNTHVDFKVLWDRWIGACQNHLTLIKILCLGGFTDPLAVPLLRFIGLCVGFLSENLTQTMILFCEVVTEEPEGGSAMISVETFIDVYTFLASIDASKDQVILNRFFPDELLQLLEERKSVKEKEEEKAKRRSTFKQMSTASELTQEEIKQEETLREIISCPDLVEEKSCEISSEESDLLDQSKSTILDDAQRITAAVGGESPKEAKKRHVKIEKKEEILGEEEELQEFFKGEEGTDAESSRGDDIYEATKDSADQDHSSEADQSVAEETKEEATAEGSLDATPAVEEKKESEVSIGKQEGQEEQGSEASSKRSSSTPISFQKIDEELEGEAGGTTVPSEKSIQPPASSSTTSTISKTVTTEIEESEVERAPVEILGEYSVAEPEPPSEEQELVIEGKYTVEEIFVEAVPGIGGVVPKELVDAVVTYMKRCAAEQQGTVMPRNIRHYSCPPLEVYV